MESVNIAVRHGDAKSPGPSGSQFLYKKSHLQCRGGSALNTMLSSILR